MTTETRSLHKKLAQVMYEAESIPKNGTAPAAMGGFKFVQVGDAANVIRKALAELSVSMIPTNIELLSEAEHATKAGGTMTTITVRTTWTLTDGDSGETTVIQSMGSGADSGDKAAPKAQTNAMKYALLMGFLLSTGDDPELSDSSDRQTRRRTATEPTDSDADSNADTTHDEGLVGIAEVGKGDADFQLRQTPDGPALLFRLVQGRTGYKVITRGALAEQLADNQTFVLGSRVTVWGTLKDESFTPQGKTKPVTYWVLHAERVATPRGTLPAPAGATETPAEAESIAMLPLDDAERALIASDLA